MSTQKAAAASSASTTTTDSCPRCPIQAAYYHGAVPVPHSRVEGPAPDEMFQAELARRARLEQEKDMAEERRAEEKSGMGPLGGFFTKAAHIKQNADRDARVIGERNLHNDEHRQMAHRYDTDFPELTKAGDVVMAEFCASVISKGHVVSGNAFITRDHVCFISKTIKDAIPLRDIVSLQRSLSLSTEEGHPHVMPVPSPNAVPDSVQIYVRDGRLIQFLNFRHVAYDLPHPPETVVPGQPADHFFNWLDHAWRAAVHVPVEGVQYAYADNFGAGYFQQPFVIKGLTASGAATAAETAAAAKAGPALPHDVAEKEKGVAAQR